MLDLTRDSRLLLWSHLSTLPYLNTVTHPTSLHKLHAVSKHGHIFILCVTCPGYSSPPLQQWPAPWSSSAEAAQDAAEVMNSAPRLLDWNLAVYSLAVQWWADFFDLSMPHL